jgi:hypothetical protein
MEPPRFPEVVFGCVITYNAHTTDFAAIRETRDIDLWIFLPSAFLFSRTNRPAKVSRKEDCQPARRLLKMRFRFEVTAGIPPLAILTHEQETHVDSKRPLDKGAGSEARHD